MWFRYSAITHLRELRTAKLETNCELSFAKACSLSINAKWWTIMPRLCSDVWSASCEPGISIYELWVELCKGNLVWKWCQNSLKKSKMGSKYGPYEVKMSSLGACESVFETNNPSWCRQGGPKADLRSSDKAFLGPFGSRFGRLCGLKRRQKMKSVSDVFLGSKFCQKLVDFGTKFEPSEDDTWVWFLKCAKFIFERQS